MGVCKPGDSRLASWKKVEQGYRLERRRENGQKEGVLWACATFLWQKMETKLVGITVECLIELD